MSDFDPFAVMRTLDGPVEPPESFGEELYAALRHSMDRHAVGAPVEEQSVSAPSPRRGLLVAAALVAAFLVMGGLLGLLAPPGDPDAAVDPLPLSEPDDTAATSIVEHNPDPAVASPPPTTIDPPSTSIASSGVGQSLGGYQFGGWTVLPASEFDGRRGAAVVWTGEQLIVWGGEESGEGFRPDQGWPVTNDGGVYDPATETWFSLPPSPLSARRDTTALWTGEEMLIIGGGGPDGAAYDPSTRLWRELPLHTIPSNPAAVWTGTEAILFGGLEPSGDAYDPSADAWREIAPLPVRSERWENPRAVWTGDEMIVWDETVRASFPEAGSGPAWDIAAYDPVTDQWRRFPPQPFNFQLSQTSGVWTGTELVLLGANFEQFVRTGDFADVPPILAIALNPVEDTWRLLSTPTFAEEGHIEGFGIHSSVWAGDRLLVWAGGFFSTEPTPELWAYDPATDAWDRGASSPVTGGDPDLIWDGVNLYAYGGELTDPVRRILTLNLPEGQPLPAPIAAGNTVDLPEDVPFELFAMEPFVQAAFIADFPAGSGRFYDRSDTFLQNDTITAVAPLGRGWMTSANGEVWWFPDSISRLPIALQNEPNVEDGLYQFTHFLPTGDDLYSDRIWTVVPGDGFSRPNARSIVRSISVETREVRTYTEAPPDVFPVNSSTTGLLLNGFEWMDTGDGFTFTEDPATFEMMLVEPDGNLLPLWSGFGLDLSVNRVVWMECDEAGVECTIVVSSIKGPSAADLRIEIPGFGYLNGAIAAPNGRWLAVGLGQQGRDNQSILIVDIIDGSYETLLVGRNLSTSFGPSVTWSADSEWIMSLDGDPLAIRLEDRLQLNLAEYLPEGMVVYAVAAR